MPGTSGPRAVRAELPRPMPASRACCVDSVLTCEPCRRGCRPLAWRRWRGHGRQVGVPPQEPLLLLLGPRPPLHRDLQALASEETDGPLSSGPESAPQTGLAQLGQRGPGNSSLAGPLILGPPRRPLPRQHVDWQELWREPGTPAKATRASLPFLLPCPRVLLQMRQGHLPRQQPPLMPSDGPTSSPLTVRTTQQRRQAVLGLTRWPPQRLQFLCLGPQTQPAPLLAWSQTRWKSTGGLPSSRHEWEVPAVLLARAL